VRGGKEKESDQGFRYSSGGREDHAGEHAHDRRKKEAWAVIYSKEGEKKGGGGGGLSVERRKEGSSPPSGNATGASKEKESRLEDTVTGKERGETALREMFRKKKGVQALSLSGGKRKKKRDGIKDIFSRMKGGEEGVVDD